MAPKKDFKKTPAEMFISAAAEPQEQEAKETTSEQAQNGVTIPKGYRLAPEQKSQRLQLLIKPSTKDGIKNAATMQGISVNELINNILEEYLERNSD